MPNPNPTAYASPADVQTMLNDGVRFIELDPALAYPGLNITKDLQTIRGNGAQVAGVRTVGRVLNPMLYGMVIGAGGIQVVGGIDHCTIDGCSLTGDAFTRMDGLYLAGSPSSPCCNVTVTNNRIRNFSGMGMMRSHILRGTFTNNWVDQCVLAGDPANSSVHGLYDDDDSNIAVDSMGFLATRCWGQGFRGAGTRAYDFIAYQCGSSIAGSRNAELMARFTSLYAGPIEIGAQGPCVVEDPYGAVSIKPTCRSQNLLIVRPHFGPGQGITGDGIYAPPGLPHQDVPGRFGTLAITDPQSIPALVLSPESYCRDVLGGVASLEDLWTRPFTVNAMNQYLRGN